MELTVKQLRILSACLSRYVETLSQQEGEISTLTQFITADWETQPARSQDDSKLMRLIGAIDKTISDHRSQGDDARTDPALESAKLEIHNAVTEVKKVLEAEYVKAFENKVVLDAAKSRFEEIIARLDELIRMFS